MECGSDPGWKWANGSCVCVDFNKVGKGSHWLWSDDGGRDCVAGDEFCRWRWLTTTSGEASFPWLVAFEWRGVTTRLADDSALYDVCSIYDPGRCALSVCGRRA